METEPRLSDDEIRDQNRRLSIQGLVDLLHSSQHEADTEALLHEFEQVYEHLPELADRIVDLYHTVLKKYRLDPGEVRLMMVGGRVKGKPLKEGSDIDLIFETANPQQNADTLLFERVSNPTDALDLRIAIKQEIMQGVKTICKEKQLPNLFHILEYGRPLTEEGQRPNALEISRH